MCCPSSIAQSARRCTSPDDIGCVFNGSLGWRNLRESVGICITGQMARLELDLKLKNVIAPIASIGMAIDMVLLLSGIDGSGAFYFEERVPYSIHGLFRSREDILGRLETAEGIRSFKVKEFNQLESHPQMPEQYGRTTDLDFLREIGPVTAVHMRQTPEQITMQMRTLETQAQCYGELMQLQAERGAMYRYFIRMREDLVMPRPPPVGSIFSSLRAKTESGKKAISGPKLESCRLRWWCLYLFCKYTNDNFGSPSLPRLLSCPK